MPEGKKELFQKDITRIHALVKLDKKADFKGKNATELQQIRDSLFEQHKGRIQNDVSTSDIFVRSQNKFLPKNEQLEIPEFKQGDDIFRHMDHLETAAIILQEIWLNKKDEAIKQIMSHGPIKLNRVKFKIVNKMLTGMDYVDRLESTRLDILPRVLTQEVPKILQNLDSISEGDLLEHSAQRKEPRNNMEQMIVQLRKFDKGSLDKMNFRDSKGEKPLSHYLDMWWNTQPTQRKIMALKQALKHLSNQQQEGQTYRG